MTSLSQDQYNAARVSRRRLKGGGGEEDNGKLRNTRRTVVVRGVFCSGVRQIATVKGKRKEQKFCALSPGGTEGNKGHVTNAADPRARAPASLGYYGLCCRAPRPDHSCCGEHRARKAISSNDYAAASTARLLVSHTTSPSSKMTEPRASLGDVPKEILVHIAHQVSVWRNNTRVMLKQTPGCERARCNCSHADM